MRILALSLGTFAVVASPVMVQAQSAQRACMQAEMDAEADVNKVLWIAAGFFLGLLGVGAAYVLEPDPPASNLLGKSPEYVAVYTDCYKRKGKSVQVKNAVIGCVLGNLLYVGAYACCLFGTCATAGAAGSTY